MHCGENGILKGAETAVDKYQNKAEQEQNELAKIDDYIQNSRQDKDNNVYSPDELVVGKWIDGKNIYRKVINFSENVSSYGNVRYIQSKIQDNVDNIINSGGWFVLGERKIQFGSSEMNWEVKPSFSSFVAIDNKELFIYSLLYY